MACGRVAIRRRRGSQSRDQIGYIDGLRSTFDTTYAAEPDVLIEQVGQWEFGMTTSHWSRLARNPRTASWAAASE